ncbi:MAG TPA: DUF1127 domain-containing protein [Roseovarius sp.]
MSTDLANQMMDPAARGNLSKDDSGSVRSWLLAAFEQWQRRKMAAALQKLDDSMLTDIGVYRSDTAQARRKCAAHSFKRQAPLRHG